MVLHDESALELDKLRWETWDPFPELPLLTGSTVPNVGRKLFIHSPSTILKLPGIEGGEGTMTALAHSILGDLVPRVVCLVDVPDPEPGRQGILFTRRPGTPLSELWPSLTIPQRKSIKEELCRLILQYRRHRFTYYGRPKQQPYLFSTIFGPRPEIYCTSRSEWDESRIRAMKAAEDAPSPERAAILEKVQRDIVGATGWDRPVLTHGDLSERNILVDPDTLEVTGFLDWESANIMPAYFEYVQARVSGGHDPEWRVEVLDILRAVLRHECGDVNGDDGEGEGRYMKTLAAWNAMVDVERPALGYSDECYWTFETGMPEAPNGPDPSTLISERKNTPAN
ncbi:predicted protein [Uncinocarpus reesii 1704]|uniref:Aminoglycoside phosphotransferase domain-containing protein n=1 Tax=Uncinocarpus reesii (strain UAMH 1704) TaxID=336963 RepID=C4JSB3_UNCRE|nr:uncharacterized protein UREG_05352 [Uncinocarpus reesii 1704]EEP80510.1 predicted protein [Uncinocarpus reesii 1704]